MIDLNSCQRQAAPDGPKLGIDFAAINAAALARLPDLVRAWLPGGRQNGAEWVCGDTSGTPGRSLSVNTSSGVWKDFSTNEGGSDSVSLFAAINGLKQGEAAKRLAAELGMGNGHSCGQKAQPKAEPKYTIVTPVPEDALEPSSWTFRGLEPAMGWQYRDQSGRLLGYVARFNHPGETNGSGKPRKDFYPRTLWRDAQGRLVWRWKSWPDLRPIYGLDRLAANPGAPVLISEGEGKTDAAGRLLGNAFVCIA